MLCGVKTGSRRRRVRDPGDTPRESVERNRSQQTLCGNHQSSPSNSQRLHMAQIPATPTTIIPRQHSANRRFRLFSLGHFISLFSAPFLTVVSGNRKPAAEILRVRGLKGATEEPQLEETMKMSTEKGSAMKTYSVSLADYRLLEVVGEGASATVYRAMYIPYNEIVAVKCVDLDRCNSNLDDIRREAQTMSLAHHPNVVKGYCSFVVEHYLWFVMPYMAEGSCFHLMKAAYPDGFEENVIGSILKETLKALENFHKHGHIHRDVKAGNILLDSSGVVKLSDFGVTASMFDKGDRQHSRNTFVGTPCWMAPEVMQPGGGYDFKADIWSFGITALELAHGHAPFSKYPPMKVLLMTLQNAPPGLDYDRDKKFSKSFKEMVAMCLVKDQTKRPTAEKLLKHAFFKNVKPPEFSVKNLLADLPPLWERVKALQLKDAEQLALKKMPSSEQEALSQTEYKRGVSAWNFDIKDLKIQASLIVDDEGITGMEEDDGSLMNFINNKILDDEDAAKTEKDFGSFRNFIHNKESPISKFTLEKPLVSDENSDRLIRDAEGPDGSYLLKKNEYHETDFQGFRSQDDIYRYDEVRLNNVTDPSTPVLDDEHRWVNQVEKKPQMLSSHPPSSMPNNSSQRGFTFKSDNDEIQLPTERYMCDTRKASNLSGPLMLPNCASANSLSAPTQFSRGFEDYPEDMCKSNLVQIKGRFSVKSVNADIAKPANQLPKENLNISLPASILVPHLQNIFQQTSFQQDLLMNLLKSMQENDIVSAFQTEISSNSFKLENDVLDLEFRCNMLLNRVWAEEFWGRLRQVLNPLVIEPIASICRRGCLQMVWMPRLYEKVANTDWTLD